MLQQNQSNQEYLLDFKSDSVESLQNGTGGLNPLTPSADSLPDVINQKASL